MPMRYCAEDFPIDVNGFVCHDRRHVFFSAGETCFAIQHIACHLCGKPLLDPLYQPCPCCVQEVDILAPSCDCQLLMVETEIYCVIHDHSIVQSVLLFRIGT